MDPIRVINYYRGRIDVWAANKTPAFQRAAQIVKDVAIPILALLASLVLLPTVIGVIGAVFGLAAVFIPLLFIVALVYWIGCKVLHDPSKVE